MRFRVYAIKVRKRSRLTLVPLASLIVVEVAQATQNLPVQCFLANASQCFSVALSDGLQQSDITKAKARVKMISEIVKLKVEHLGEDASVFLFQDVKWFDEVFSVAETVGEIRD